MGILAVVVAADALFFMATKTLGIKFEVAGVKEAQAGLDNLRKNLNRSLAHNKKVASGATQIKTKSAPKSDSFSKAQGDGGVYDYIENHYRTVERIRQKQYKQAFEIYSRPRFNQIQSGFFGGIGESLGDSSLQKLANHLGKAIGSSKTRDSIDLSSETIEKIGGAVGKAINKVLAIGFKAASPKKGLVENLKSIAIAPIKNTYQGFYQGVGMKLGDNFSKGFANVIKEDLDIDFERNGEVAGKIVTLTIQQGFDGLYKNFEDIKQKSKNFADTVKNKNAPEAVKAIDELYKSIARSLASIPNKLIANYKLANVMKASVKKAEKKVDDVDISQEQLEGMELAVINVAGMGGDGGKGGYKQAEELRKLADEKTVVFTSENPNTDVSTKNIDGKVNSKWLLESISTIGKLNLKGFNQDAIELAAKVAKIRSLNKDIPISLAGYSGGGYVVEEALKILEQMGIEGVRGTSFATPNFRGGVKSDNINRFMGEKDLVLKVQAAAEYLGAVDKEKEQKVSGKGGHNFYQSVNNPEIRESIFGDNLASNAPAFLFEKAPLIEGKLIELESLYARYMSQVYQDLEEVKDELSIAPDRLIAKNRRRRLRDRGGKEVQRKLDEKDFRELKVKPGVETAVLVSGGFSGAKGRSGAKFASQLNNLVDDDKTQYIGVRNPFTDVVSKEEVRDPDPGKTIPKILDMFGKVHSLGYNPDSAEIAAEVIDLLEKNPDLKVKIGGYSGGGYVAEDVMELLKSRGVDLSRVEVMGVGAPQLPGGIKNAEFKKVLGAKDPIMLVNQLKEFNNQVKEILGFDILPELMTRLQNIEGIENHDLDEYVANSREVQDFFYGHIPDSGELVQNHSKIINLQKETKQINDRMNQVAGDDSINSATKLEQLQAIKDRYIELLTQIHSLAKRSDEIGGGKFFKEEREATALELEDAGIIIDPIEVPVETEDYWEEAEIEEKELLQERNKNLALRYKKHLQNLVKETRDDSSISSQLIARDFASESSDKQNEFLIDIRKEFTKKAKAYRDAVRSGQLEIAKEQGEKLLVLAASIKSLYSELSEFDELDPEVQKTFKSYSGYITSVENEIIEGGKGKGRVERGLPDIFAGELNNNSDELGENVAEGFIEGILADLVEAKLAGENLVDAAEEGIRDRGEIQSPSKLTKRLGQWFARGFGLGMSAEDLEEKGKEVVEKATLGLEKQLKTTLGADNIANLLDTSGASLIKKIGELLFQSIQDDNADKILGVLSNLIGKVLRLFITFKLLKVALDALGLKKFIDAFQDLFPKSLDAAIAVEALDNRIINMSESARAGAKNLKFITDEAARLNRNLTDAKENYAQVLGAVRDSSLEGFQAENIYTAFAATAKKNALDRTSEQELFRSVRSIIGKNIVSQEEVRQEIGEKLGDFELSLAQAYGVSRPQLNQMISDRQIIATEALPKVAAVLRAKNDIQSDLDTGAAAAQRADNAIVSFQESIGSALLPLQKAGNNFLANFFNKLAKSIDILKPLVNGFFLALFANLLRLQIFGQSLQKVLLGLTKLLWTIKGAIAVFTAEMLLVAAAWGVWENVIKIFNSRFFPKANKEIEQLTNGLKAYTKAIYEANNAQSNLNNGELKLNQGLDLSSFPDWMQNLAGGDKLNFDNLIRDRWNDFLDRAGKSVGRPLKGRLKSVRELQSEQLQINNSNLSLKGNQLLSNSRPAFDAIEEITKYDAEIAEIQSARLSLLPGDADALKASVEAEKRINKERDKQLRITTSYQQTLTTAVGLYKNSIEQIEQKYLNKEISPEVYKTLIGDRKGLLADTEELLKELNGEMSKVSKALSLFQRRLRNSNERVEGFLNKSDRDLQLQRTKIIEAGVTEGTGTQVIQIELEEAQIQDLSRRIAFVKSELKNLERDLQSPELASGVRRVTKLLSDKNIPLNETSLQRIIEESTVQADREAAQGLLDKLKRDTQIVGLKEQLAQTIQSNRNAIKDFARTIDDFFFNITTQIKEAQIEVLRVLDQIIQTNIRNKLQAAISPNANSFVNSLIQSTQSLLDQAASYAEKILGQRGARIQSLGQRRSLQYELNDFARNVRGAGDALIEFKNKIAGAGSKDLSATNAGVSPAYSTPARRAASPVSQPSNSNSSQNASTNLIALRRAIIGKESGANFKAVNPHSGALGYGQLMPYNVKPWTKQALGKSLTAKQFLNNPDAQLKTIDFKLKQYLDRELKKGFDLDTAVRRVASTWYSGQPQLYNNTRPQTYGAGKYPSIDSYTADILNRFKAEGGGTSAEDNNNVIDKANRETKFLTGKLEQKVDLGDNLLKLEEEALKTAIDQNLKADRRKIDEEITNTQFALSKLLGAGEDMASQYNYQTAPVASAKNIREVNNAFSDRGLEISRQITKYVDEIGSINKLVAESPRNIKLLRNAGKNDEADFLVEKVSQSKLLLKPYRDMLKNLTDEYLKVTEEAETALLFVTKQNQLKEKQEQLNTAMALLSQKAAIAEARGTIEAGRKVKKHQEDLRLYLQINDLLQKYAPGEYLDSSIAGAKRQSQVNQDNINYQSRRDELNLEKQLIDRQIEINNKRSSLFSRFGGVNFNLEKRRKNLAIEAENKRYADELIDAQSRLKDKPEELEEFARSAAELNSVNLSQIKNEFKTLGKTVEDIFISSTQGFFTNINTSLFDAVGQKDKALFDERLRYAEQLVGLENQYRNEPGQLAHLKNRARELNEQKLDKIKSEFNLFKRGVDLARQALIDFVKQLSAAIAKAAAAKLIGTIVGSVVGGAGGGVSAVGNDYGSGAGASAFVANKGATVGDDIKSRKISDRTTNYLRQNNPGVNKAWRLEGRGAKLGVFHDGEELLSHKTGEAPIYQTLKSKLGLNPLQQLVPYFADGGTFDARANILSKFKSTTPKASISALNNPSRSMPSVKNITLQTTVITPDADSFRLNEDQRNQDLIIRLQRGI